MSGGVGAGVSLNIGLRGTRQTAPLTQTVSVTMKTVKDNLQKEGCMRRILLLAIVLIAISLPGGVSAAAGDQL